MLAGAHKVIQVGRLAAQRVSADRACREAVGGWDDEATHGRIGRLDSGGTRRRRRRWGSPRPAPAFPIVGVGASAGGLDAFTQLLEHLPADSGMAFVLIQHLDPTHASFLRDALAKATTMTVSQAEDGTAVEPNHVYVIPPDADISIQRRPVDARVAGARRSTVAPVRRWFPPLARRGPRQPRDRRRAFGERFRRHGGPAGHQGGERHHVRAGSGFGEVRRDAAQRGQCRRRRRRAGDPRARPRAGASEPPPLRRSRRGPARRPATPTSAIRS